MASVKKRLGIAAVVLDLAGVAAFLLARLCFRVENVWTFLDQRLGVSRDNLMAITLGAMIASAVLIVAFNAACVYLAKDPPFSKAALCVVHIVNLIWVFALVWFYLDNPLTFW